MQKEIAKIIRDCQSRGATIAQLGSAVGLDKRTIHKKIKNKSFTDEEAIRMLRAAGMPKTAEAYEMTLAELEAEKQSKLERLLNAS